MDSLTHSLVGAALGELILGKRIGKKAMLIGAIAGNAPDIDALMNFFVSDLDALLWHRGITHSVFVAAVVGPLLGWLFWFKSGKRFLPGWIALFTLNLWTHEFLDTCTMYGTALFMPFSDERYAFNNIFVVDPIYTLPILVSTSVLIFMSGNNNKRNRVNLIGLAVSSLYMISTFFSQSIANNSLAVALQQKGVSNAETVAVPTLFNTMLWNVTAKAQGGFWVGYVSVFDTDSAAQLYFIPDNDSLNAAFVNDRSVQRLAEFTNGFYVLRKHEDRNWFHDLRFGQVQGWSDPNSMFGFSFDLSPGADNSMVVQQGRIEGLKIPVIKSMWNRMLGRSLVVDTKDPVHGEQHAH
jgi:inner membrane protein